MKKFKTEDRVRVLMEEHPETRYDDMILFAYYYSRFGKEPVGALPLSSVAYDYRKYGLPCYETIRRARQKVQEQNPKLSRRPLRESAEKHRSGGK